LRQSVARATQAVDENSTEALTIERQIRQSEQSRAQQVASLEQLRSSIQARQELLEKLAETNRVVYEISGGHADEPWLLDLGETEWLLAPADRKEKPMVFDARDLDGRISALENWARTSSDQKHLVLLVRPSGIESYELIRSDATLPRCSFGVDLIGADVTVIDRQTGAVVQ
jgi:hypothetical protein